MKSLKQILGLMGSLSTILLTCNTSRKPRIFKQKRRISLTKLEKSDQKVNFKIFQANMQDVKEKLLDIEVIPNEICVDYFCEHWLVADELCTLKIPCFSH